MDRRTLVDLQLHKDEIIPGAVEYYLSAVYKYENDMGIYEVTVPKIEFPIHEDYIDIHIPAKNGYRDYLYPESEPTINLGFGHIRMSQDKHGHFLYERLVEEKIHDMTISEIEKKLGYKIRVISEEG